MPQNPRTATLNPLNINDDEFRSATEEIRRTLPEGHGTWSNLNFTEKASSAMNSFVTNKYKDFVETLRENAPTVLLVGDTGLGKSSLVNVVFDLKLGVTDQYADVADGAPCTQNFVSYGPSDTSPVRIIDSKGVEKLTVAAQMNEIMDYVKERATSSNILEHVHLVYYFVGLSRWQDADKRFVESLLEHCGVILVLNKRDLRTDAEVDSLRHEIRKHFPKIDIAECGDPRGTRNWIPNTCKYNHGEEYIEVSMRRKTWICEYVVGHEPKTGFPMYCGDKGDDSPFGHKELVRMSGDLLPNLVRKSFRSAQRVDLLSRHIQAAAIIAAATAAAAGVGGIPVPFADLPVLLVLEGAMAASLMAVYGIPLTSFNGKTLMALNSSIIGIGGRLGYLTAQLFKAIPAVGAAAGGSIDMLVAGTAVMTLGVSIAAVQTCFLQQGYDYGEVDPVSQISNVTKFVDVTELLRSFISGRTDKSRLQERIVTTIRDASEVQNRNQDR